MANQRIRDQEDHISYLEMKEQDCTNDMMNSMEGMLYYREKLGKAKAKLIQMKEDLPDVIPVKKVCPHGNVLERYD